MDKQHITKEYTNGEVTVVWQAGKCMHSGNCVRNLRKVFDPKMAPWINMQNGTTEEIIETVRKCPSGALTIK